MIAPTRPLCDSAKPSPAIIDLPSLFIFVFISLFISLFIFIFIFLFLFIFIFIFISLFILFFPTMLGAC